MIELDDSYMQSTGRKSSRGNQLKWQKDNKWYKADQNGYESLSEFAVSQLLKRSSLQTGEYVDYSLEQIRYKYQVMNACSSDNFLAEGESLITIERLFQSCYHKALAQVLSEMDGVSNRIKFLVNFVEETTGLTGFGAYVSKMLVIDELFLNDDRHTHNIALIMNKDCFKTSPLFDNGAGLLSDTRTDFPMAADLFALRSTVRAKPFSESFAEQSLSCQNLYGLHVSFSFNDEDIDNTINAATGYSEAVKERVKQILKYQRNKNQFYFK